MVPDVVPGESIYRSLQITIRTIRGFTEGCLGNAFSYDAMLDFIFYKSLVLMSTVLSDSKSFAKYFRRASCSMAARLWINVLSKFLGSSL